MRHPSRSPVRRRRRAGVLPLAVVGVLVSAAACTPDSGGSGGGASGESPKPQARIQIRPGDGTEGVSPAKPISVTVQDGSVKNVSVRAKPTGDADQKPGLRIEGKLAANDTRWRSTEPLLPAVRYTVKATAVDDNGLATSVTTSFTTVKPDSLLQASIAPLDGETVGVGMPITLYLSKPVADEFKDDVERRLDLTMSEPVEGAWHWMDDETLSFRPRDYWPAGQHVRLETNWIGVRAGEGLWGDQSRVIEFDVGERHVSVVDADQHTMTVKSGGDVVNKFPISAGDSDHPSSSGILVAKAKQGDIVMDSASYGVPVDSPEGYRVRTKWNVRITDSGQFVHGAPWSVEAQGERNVSHGCVNMSLDDAKWFYRFTQRGDVIEVTGTQRNVQWRNGWTHWNMSWDEWVAGSALDRAINGSG